MPRLVAFLRGINVGGHVVRKEKLQETFVSLGFKNISTFKQSGNVIFDTTTMDLKEIKSQIENKLYSALGFKVLVFLRTIAELKGIIEFQYLQHQENGKASLLVTILEIPVPAKFSATLPNSIPKTTVKIIQAKKSEVFSVTHGGGEGALPNPFIESKLKAKATTRNINTIRGIVEKFGEGSV